MVRLRRRDGVGRVYVLGGMLKGGLDLMGLELGSVSELVGVVVKLSEMMLCDKVISSR